ncbi:flagellar hook capping FlgD N-terminal domain-containing protein [Armatimonas sp.]|uniref:flagellar hook capping FlgD N-terminal domain-containing protein n=1 Tax=Armatimonas sp. TaxID=1872638 RepID=UPI00286A733F|nr:flagellar hook capping FlgD N-terminal domain-containing protein [Armatimonas sp.]
MSINAINNQTTSTASLTKATENTLGKQDFLTLLTTQLRNQDPLSPMSNEEFIAQMAQISTLESSLDMGKQLTTLINAQQRTQALQMVGHDVDYMPEGGDVAKSGRVSAVILKNDLPVLMINGEQIPYTNVQSIH